MAHAEHLAADEHHVDWCGEKCDPPVTAGTGCILGIEVTPTANDPHRGLHRDQRSGERRQRGWALLLNFIPFAPRAN